MERALRLPEIVGAVLAQLLLRLSQHRGDYICAPDAGDNDVVTAAAATAAGRAALRAAALVNHTWCAVALPLLWRCPSEQALQGAGAQGIEMPPARQAVYAAYIRTVRVSGQTPLLRALAGADGDSGGVGDNINVSGRRNGEEGDVHGGSDHGGSTGGQEKNDGSGSGSSEQHEEERGRLRLSRLTALHVKQYWPREVRSYNGWDDEVARLGQAPLEPFIGAHLTELSCHLTSGVMERLEGMLAATPLLQQHQQQKPGVRPSERQAGQSKQAELPRATTKADNKKPRIQLRRLRLYGRDTSALSGASFDAAEERLVVWLTQTHVCSAGPHHALKSLRLVSVFEHRGTALADRVFRHFALHGRLQQLWLDNSPGGVADGSVSLAAVKDIIATINQEGCISADNDSHGASVDFRLRHADFSSERRQQQPDDSSCCNRPFEHLKDLKVRIAPSAMPSLARLLLPASISRLSVAALDEEGDPVLIPDVFRSLGTLRQLRALQLQLHDEAPIAPADLRALHSLTRLRELDISGGEASDVVDDDVAALLGALPLLRTLGLRTVLPGLSRAAEHTMGATNPLLRGARRPLECHLGRWWWVCTDGRGCEDVMSICRHSD
jgi:hypothetical protein